MKNRNNWILWLILITGLLITYIAAIYTKSEIDKKDEAEFRFECIEIGSKIEMRLHAHAQLLRSGAAFFGASDSVSRENWRDFIEQSKVDLNLPGIQGIGFSLLIPKDELTTHIQQIRNEGFPDYKIWPEGEREFYTSIIYLEPFEGSNLRAFGYDLMTEPTRRDALERARDMDIATLTKKVLLVQESGTDVQAGTIMYVPVYQKGMSQTSIEERRKSIIGWVSSPYRMNDLISGILINWELEDNWHKFYLHIYDGLDDSSESLLFESHKPEEQNISEKIRFELELPIDFNGHQWKLMFTEKKENIIMDNSGSLSVLIVGIIISILLFLLTKSLINTKYNAQIIAETLTSELKENERLLKESQRIAKLGSYSLDLETGLWKSSEIFDYILGIDENYERSVEGWTLLIHPDYKELITDYLNNNVIKQGQAFDKEYKIIRNNDKEERWIHGLGKLEFDSNNTPIALIGTIIDITEQKLAEERLKLSREQYRSIFENSPLGIYQTTTDGKIINANPSLLKMLEFDSLSDLQKRDLEKDGYSEDSSVSRQDFVEMINKDGYVKGLEESWITKNGKVIPIRENARIVKGNEGAIAYYEGTVEDITERKKNENQLRLSQERYSIAVEGSNDGIWDWDIIANELYFSPRWKSILGYDDDELVNSFSTWEDLLHPEDQKSALSTIQAYFNNEIPEYQVEFRMKHKDGSYRWILARGKALRDKTGKPLRMAGSHTDITKNKLAEKELKESENKLRTIIEASPVPIVLTKVNDGVVIMANDNLGKLFKISVSEATGQKSPDFYHNKKDRDTLLKAVITDGYVNNYELVLKKSDGELFWCSVSLKLMSIDNEQVLIAGFHDITERKKAEEEILKHRERLEEMVDKRTQELTISEQKLKQSVKDISDYKLALDESSIVAITDNKGIIKYVNDNFCKTSKYSREELIGESNRIIDSGFHSEEFFNKMQRTITSGQVWRGEVRNKAKDGSFYWVDSTIVPFLDKNGKPYQYVVVRFDITNRKTTEADLIKSKEEADSANRSKSEFLANMSHEIRTPMNAVIGFSELLSNSVKDEKQRSQVESIHSSGKNLLKIINDILDLSKIEAGKIDIKPVPINLCNLLDEIENMFVQKVKEKGIILSIDYEKIFPKTLLLDEIRFRQILFNLIGNAVKFTDLGQVSISIEKCELKKEKENVDLIVIVKDTGIGIPVDQQEFVFDPFNQQTGQNVVKYGGTGLGLSITKKLVERMGGNINLESEVGKGSTFRINLPNIPVLDIDVEAKHKAFDTSTVLFEPGTVLIVDDNDENRNLIIDLLENSHLTLLQAINGKEAVEMAKKYIPDLILMDLRMPVMDGYEATKILIDDKLTKSIPVIAVTASIKSSKERDHIKKVFDEYLFKPGY